MHNICTVNIFWMLVVSGEDIGPRKDEKTPDMKQVRYITHGKFIQ